MSQSDGNQVPDEGEETDDNLYGTPPVHNTDSHGSEVLKQLDSKSGVGCDYILEDSTCNDSDIKGNEEESDETSNSDTKHENFDSQNMTENNKVQRIKGNSTLYRAGTGKGIQLNTDRDNTKSKLKQESKDVFEGKETLLSTIHELRTEVNNLKRKLSKSEKNCSDQKNANEKYIQEIVNGKREGARNNEEKLKNILKEHSDEINNKDQKISSMKEKEEKQSELIAITTKSLNQANQKLKQELHEMSVIQEQLTGENEQLKKDKQKLELCSSQMEQDNTLLKQDRDHLAMRLSEEWNKKVASDETNIENVSIKNRPLNIADHYGGALCSNTWLDMKNHLDEVCHGVSEEEKHHFLRDVILKCEQVCTDRYKEVMKNLSTLLLNPARPLDIPSKAGDSNQIDINKTTGNRKDSPIAEPSKEQYNDESMDFDDENSKDTKVPHDQDTQSVDNTTDESTKQTEPNKQLVYIRVTQTDEDHMKLLPEGLTNTIGDYFRCNADNIDINEFVKSVIDIVSCPEYKTDVNLKLADRKSLKTYIEACVRVTWKMVIQRPKMYFRMYGIGEKWNDKCQEPAYGGDNPNHPNSIVQYYIYPALIHANKVMTKGRVFTKIP